MLVTRTVVGTTLVALFLAVAFAQLHAQEIVQGSVPPPNSTPTPTASPISKFSTHSYAGTLLNADLSAARESGQPIILAANQRNSHLRVMTHILNRWSRYCEVSVSVMAEQVDRAAGVRENEAGGVEVTKSNDGRTSVTLTRVSLLKDWNRNHTPALSDWCLNQERIAEEEARKIIQQDFGQRGTRAGHVLAIKRMLLSYSNLCDVKVKVVTQYVHALAQALDEAAKNSEHTTGKTKRYAVVIWLGDNLSEIKGCNLPESLVTPTATRRPTITPTPTPPPAEARDLARQLAVDDYAKFTSSFSDLDEDERERIVAVYHEYFAKTADVCDIGLVKTYNLLQRYAEPRDSFNPPALQAKLRRAGMSGAGWRYDFISRIATNSIIQHMIETDGGCGSYLKWYTRG